MPVTPFIARISWLIEARNSLFARVAASASFLGRAHLLLRSASAR